MAPQLGTATWAAVIRGKYILEILSKVDGRTLSLLRSMEKSL